MDSTMFNSDFCVMCNSFPIMSRAGAAIDEERGERKAKAEMMREI
jgi:hypothetical protein